MTVNSAAMNLPLADGESLSVSTPQFVDPLAALRRESSHDLEDADARHEAAAAPQRHPDTRLDVARGLFAALRHKHLPTAGHSLRVAVACCAWGEAQRLSVNDRETLEIAALLHDIGKLGAPDRLLLKPGVLAADEASLMDWHRLSGLEVLADCCPVPAAMEIVRHSAAWFDGSRANYPLSGERIPTGARMLAIVDAFDSMTSDQVYRGAMSRERALHELFSHAGTQFDPQLVKSFSELHCVVQTPRAAAGHWLEQLDPNTPRRHGRDATIPAEPASNLPPGLLFQQKLLDNMYDAVIFVDSHMQIIQWNRGAERLTGIAAASVLHRTWSPALVEMSDARTGPLADRDCPVAYCIRSGVQSLRRLHVTNRNARPIAVDAHTVPVVAQNGTTYGATIQLHDASSETSLEQRCQNLHERATRDPLTQVANRAEFDRTHQLFVQAHIDRQLPCSLIMSDIDHFKTVNDTYGHQAGDEVLKLFGAVLASECRAGDLVARYGGEEFIVLCADCNNSAAARRAEQLRRTIAELSHPALKHNNVTASFGVTEVQPGDTPASMLRRADRALMEAKRLGRNTVVQLGAGLRDFDVPAENPLPLQTPRDGLLAERNLVTSVPLKITVEKLRGCVTDHNAKVLAIKADRIEFQIEAEQRRSGRRRSDRSVPFLVALSLAERRQAVTGPQGRSAGNLARTQVSVEIRLKSPRDARSAGVMDQASSILASIKSYLMATEETESVAPRDLRCVVNLATLWNRA